MLQNGSELNRTDPFSCASASVEAYRYVGVVWGSLVTVVGTVGNILTILAFFYDTRLRTRFNLLILNLSLADLLYCLVLQPVSVDSYLHLRWRGGASWCRVFGFLLFLSNSVSILTLCLIAVSRYLLIVYRSTAVGRLLFSGRGLMLLIACTWVVGSASFAPLWPVYVFTPQVCTCSFHRTKGRPYTTVLLLLYFLLGLGCVGFFYFLIYRRVRVASNALLQYRPSRRSSRRKRLANQGPATDDSGIVDTSTATQSSEVISQNNPEADKLGGEPEPNPGTVKVESCSRLEKKTTLPETVVPAPAPTSSPVADGEFKRVTRMCFTVFMCFVGSFTPFLLLNMADRKGHAPQALHMLCANLTWLNSCINPVLYTAMNRQFNQAYRDLVYRAISPLTKHH
ncbi:G-protein coupled receptor 84 [Denticeps clupeoides]|uniref:G-protein coupled receptor 84 n=1 Tax=Denticeps clupeoides TaxID=299321 RepID=UPI0010A4B8A1|nr:G-protein coupled receptor 84 [Denticeps clupeoides]